jgi:hypothetical protein
MERVECVLVSSEGGVVIPCGRVEEKCQSEVKVFYFFFVGGLGCRDFTS